jgi:hypothetical protein
VTCTSAATFRRRSVARATTVLLTSAVSVQRSGVGCARRRACVRPEEPHRIDAAVAAALRRRLRQINPSVAIGEEGRARRHACLRAGCRADRRHRSRHETGHDDRHHIVDQHVVARQLEAGTAG